MFCTPKPQYNICDFCQDTLNLHKEYIYHIIGPGKHHGKDICTGCLLEKLKKRYTRK